MVEMMVVPYARVGDSNSGSSWEDSTSTDLLVYDISTYKHERMGSLSDLL